MPNKKFILIILGFIILVGTILAGIAYWYSRPPRKSDSTPKQISQPSPVTQQPAQIEAAKNKRTISGKITEVKPTQIKLAAPIGEQTLYLESKTEYFKRIDRVGYKTGVISDLKVGLEVNVGYYEDSKQVFNIWY